MAAGLRVTGASVQRCSASGASGSVSATRRMRSSPNVSASRASCQPSRALRAACGTNSGELLTGGRLDPGQLQLQPRDGGRRRGPLEPGEEEPLDRLGLGGRLGEALLDDELAGRARAARRRGRASGGDGARAAAIPRAAS